MVPIAVVPVHMALNQRYKGLVIVSREHGIEHKSGSFAWCFLKRGLVQGDRFTAGRRFWVEHGVPWEWAPYLDVSNPTPAMISAGFLLLAGLCRILEAD